MMVLHRGNMPEWSYIAVTRQSEKRVADSVTISSDGEIAYV